MNYLPKGLEWGVIKDNLLELGVPEDIIKRMEDAANIQTIMLSYRAYRDIKLFNTLNFGGPPPSSRASPTDWVDRMMPRWQSELFERLAPVIDRAIHQLHPLDGEGE